MSFSSRLPKAVSLGDASTLSTHLALFNPFHMLDLRHLLHLDGPGNHSVHTQNAASPTEKGQRQQRPNHEDAEDDNKSANHSTSSGKTESANLASPNRAREEKLDNFTLQASPPPIVAMVTKHANGTLNLWHLALSDQSKFTQVLSVSHVTRISGHRFRVNNITCHPVLPLLLTTSHHNVINSPDGQLLFREKNLQCLTNW